MERVSAQYMLFSNPLLKYLTCNFNDFKPGLFMVIQRRKSWCQSEAHWWFPIWPFLCLTLYLPRYSRYLMPKFRDLTLGLFKVIQGQRSWCQSAHGCNNERVDWAKLLGIFPTDWFSMLKHINQTVVVCNQRLYLLCQLSLLWHSFAKFTT